MNIPVEPRSTRSAPCVDGEVRFILRLMLALFGGRGPVRHEASVFLGSTLEERTLDVREHVNDF